MLPELVGLLVLILVAVVAWFICVAVGLPHIVAVIIVIVVIIVGIAGVGGRFRR